ncbi:MAG: oligoribonuclease [Bowdeniella nasicola]|nr:oligoribonuclease [Bowdeniella nasicola]
MSPTAATKDRLVWIDCEMTGLDLERDELVEVAVIVTDSELNPLDGGIDVLIKPSDAALAQMNDFVRDMHTKSGLLEELEGAGTLEAATEAVLAYIRRHVPEERRAPLAGNSVGTDKAFLAKDMPAVVEHLHYRMVDVSSIKELARRWYPRAYYHSPEKNGGHRALADIAESIDELRYYRAALWPDGEGPSSQECKAVAEQVSGEPTLKRAEAKAAERERIEKAISR